MESWIPHSSSLCLNLVAADIKIFVITCNQFGETTLVKLSDLRRKELLYDLLHYQTQYRHSTSETRACSVVLLGENPKPHTERISQNQIRCSGWEKLVYTSYSQDLAPLDIPLFSALKAALSGCYFHNNVEMEQTFGQILSFQSNKFYLSGFFNWIYPTIIVSMPIPSMSNSTRCISLWCHGVYF